MKIYQVDAFTDKVFGGNPAAVIPLTAWLSDEQMQQIAVENNLSETAFIVPKPNGSFHIRWFMPALEVDLCGHATLAAAHVYFTHLEYANDEISFDSRSGILTVKKESNGTYALNFPADTIVKDTSKINAMSEALKVNVLEVWKGRDDLMVVLENETTVQSLQPDFRKVAAFGGRGVICTAKGDEAAFVSRCFFPASGIEEDPVTGSAHTTMIVYWSEKLIKNKMTAHQISPRGGVLFCKYLGKRVEIAGNAVTYMIGEIFL